MNTQERRSSGMSSLKDRRRARHPILARITNVRIDVSHSSGARKSVVWSGLNLPKIRVEGRSLLDMGQVPRRPGKHS
jgi:hypothetical protein